jgi:hypothetical protein
MGIGDLMPSGGYRPKKPLTKAQLKKMQQSYAKAEGISKTVKELEQKEQTLIQWETENLLNLL